MGSAKTAGDEVGDTLDAAVDAVGSLDLDALDPAQTARLLVRLGRTIDRLEGETARLAAAVDRSEVWRGSGAPSMPAWWSTQTGIGLGRARAAVELGDTARALRLALAHLAEQQRLDNTGRTADQRRVDALGDLAAAHNRGEVTGGRNLPRIIVTMTLDDLASPRGAGRDTLTGDVITPAEIDQLCCDAIIHRYIADQTGATLNFGRGRRTASPNQHLALVARDHGCRHPGCDRPPQWCQAHHLRQFAARGGLTNLDEMVLLCHHHHHALHDHGWTLTGNPTHLTFTGPTGQTLHSPLPHNLPRRDTTIAA